MSERGPRGLEAAARVKCRQDEELMLLPDWGDLDGDQQDALRGEVSDIITAYLAVTRPVVTTVEELVELPVRTVVVDKYGDVCEKRRGWWIRYEPGLINTASMAYSLPARVIWRPHESA